MTSRVGVLLAAGAGRRAGGPKVLRRDEVGSPWLVRSILVLLDGGCDEVVVVLGAAAPQARDLLADHLRLDTVRTVEAEHWADGMGVSLRVGLEAVRPQHPAAVVVHLVDLPDVSAAVVQRLLEHASGPDALARATYQGTPGHPVLIGADHLGPIAAELTGDRGAQDYLIRHGVDGVECGDLATGQDRDTQE